MQIHAIPAWGKLALYLTARYVISVWWADCQASHLCCAGLLWCRQGAMDVVSCFHPNHEGWAWWQRLVDVLELQGNVHIWFNSWNISWRLVQETWICVKALLLWDLWLDMYFSEQVKSSHVNKDPKPSVSQTGCVYHRWYVECLQVLQGQTCKHFGSCELL